MSTRLQILSATSENILAGPYNLVLRLDLDLGLSVSLGLGFGSGGCVLSMRVLTKMIEQTRVYLSYAHQYSHFNCNVRLLSHD